MKKLFLHRVVVKKKAFRRLGEGCESSNLGSWLSLGASRSQTERRSTTSARHRAMRPSSASDATVALSSSSSRPSEPFSSCEISESRSAPYFSGLESVEKGGNCCSIAQPFRWRTDFMVNTFWTSNLRWKFKTSWRFNTLRTYCYIQSIIPMNTLKTINGISIEQNKMPTA